MPRAETLVAYARTYEFGEVSAALQVRAEGGHLVVEAIGGRQVYELQRAKPPPVIPLSETEFYVDSRFHTRIAFTRDPAGTVTGAVLNPGRWEQKGRRID